jgi:uncharacterized membrane protein YkvA (DUF1232 family)
VLHVVVASVTALVVTWLLLALVLVVGLARSDLKRRPAGELVRLFPDTLRLLRDLARTRSLPRTVRWRLYLALAYNVQPLNLIPDFIPVLGLLDNAVITFWAIRSAVRLAGPETIDRHWRGSPEALAWLCRLARLDPPQINGTPAAGDIGLAVPEGIEEC